MAKNQKKKAQRKQSKPVKKPVNPYLYLAGILLLTIIVYASAMNHDFIYQFDDDLYVTNNPDIQSLTWENIKTVFSKSYVGLFLPLTMLTYMAEFAVFGATPEPYHIVNLLIHLANIMLVFTLIRRLKPGVYVASIVAFVFALHPMHVESVTWISERKDVLYTFFYLSAIIMWLRYIDRKNTKNFLLTLALFIPALLSKTIAVSFPLFLVAFDWYRGRQLFSKQVILEKIPFFALSLAFGLLGVYFTSTANDTSTPDIAWAFRPFIVSDAILIYLRKFIAPFNLMNYYYYPDTSAGTIPTEFYISTALSASIIAGAVIWVFKAGSKQRDLILGFLFFIIPTMFVLQLIPAGRAYAAERYTYVSYIGISYIFGVFTHKLITNKTRKNVQLRAMLIGILVFFGIGFVYLTWERNKDWKDSFTLFTDLVEKNPNHYHPYLIRGITHIQFGNKEAALKDYNKSISLNPNNPKALANRASAKGMLGDYQGALEDVNRALEIDPTHENALSNRTTAYIFSENFEAALDDLNYLIEKNPTKTEYINKRILVNEKLNRPHDLLADYLLLVELRPDDYINYGKVGELYFRLDKNEEAIAYFTKAMELKPNYYQPLFLRGNAYYKINEFSKALSDFTRFATYANDPNAYYNAGMSHMMLKEMPKACEAWQKAQELGHASAAQRIADNCK